MPVITILLSLYTLSVAWTSPVYADDNALEKAETTIKAYFDAILGEQSTLAPNMAMSTAIEAVPEKDRSALQDFYDKTSFSAAKQAIDTYAQKVTAGQDASNAADSMHEVEDGLNPDTLQKIKLYYDQVKKTNPKMSAL